MNEDSRERFPCSCLRESTRNPRKDGEKWSMWKFMFSMLIKLSTEGAFHGLCHPISWSRWDWWLWQFRYISTVCLLQGLLLNSCSKSCGWRKKGKIVSCHAPKPDSSKRRKEGKFACCWWFHCESILSQPLWSFKNVKKISNSYHAEWVLHCLGSWNTIKFHVLRYCVKASQVTST